MTIKRQLEKIIGKPLKQNFRKSVSFKIRSNDSKVLVYILIGYKKFIWKRFFERFKSFTPSNYDICLVSSGIFCTDLDDLAKKNGWSYIYSKKNNVSIIQNLVIESFSSADLIFKIDEDILLTNGVYDSLFKKLEFVRREGKYSPSFVAPLINVNGYSYSILLEKFGKKNLFIKKFGSAKIESGPNTIIESSAQAALFMWGFNKNLPDLDEMSDYLRKDKFKYSVCPIRFSIGMILFERSVWNEMDGFPVWFGNGMGADETKINELSIENSKVPIVDENALVGHAGFGQQTLTIKSFFKDNE